MENQPIQPTQNPVQSDAVFADALKKENIAMKPTKLFIPLLVVFILLGVGTGFVGATLTAPRGQVISQPQSDAGAGANENVETAPAVKVGQVVGAKDATAFKDSVEGVLVPGGVGGEGSHHIVRVGGASQNVYLTSSIMDLKLFEGARVKVSGETFKAQKAGWLMDVGRLEVKELNASLPDGAVIPSVTEESQ